MNTFTDALSLVRTSGKMPVVPDEYVEGDVLEEASFGTGVTTIGLVLVESVDAEPDWQENALCAQTDPEAFFPEKGGSTREAKRICAGCEVRAECLEYALANDERFGIWGGLSERERRRLRRVVI